MTHPPYYSPGEPPPPHDPHGIVPGFGSAPADQPPGGMVDPFATMPHQVNSPAGYGGQPVSGQPMSGPPGQPGTPVSGAPGVMPFAAPPPDSMTMALPHVAAAGMDVVPGGPPPAGPKASGRGPWLVALAASTALFLVLAAVMTGLYISVNSDLEKERATVAARDKTIEDTTKKKQELEKSLQDTQKKLNDANERVKGNGDDNKRLAEQNDIITKCLKITNEFLAALAANNVPLAQQKATERQQPCQQAEQYLN